MDAIIKINMDNEAFDYGQFELARLLRVAADKAERGDREFNLIDGNGNQVGTCKIE